MSTRLCFPAERGSVAEARAAVRLALRRERWDDESTELVVLAICETLTNAIEHGSVPDDPIEVEVAATAAHAEIRVTDRGRPGAGHPAGIPAPPPPSAERGRGLIIMSELADALEIRRVGAGTEVRLQFIAPVTFPAWNAPISHEPVLA